MLQRNVLGRGLRILVATVLLAGGLAGVGLVAGHVGPSPGFVPLASAAASPGLGVAGVTPTAVSLNWTSAAIDCFNNYTLETSTAGSGGPWTAAEIDTTSSSTVYVATGLAPGSTSWWEVVEWSCHSSTVSNVVKVIQPMTATLTDSEPSATAVKLTWSNLAKYGGALSFQSYTVNEAVNGSAFAPVDSISTESTMSFLVQGLQTGSHYSFQVVTNDLCSTACSGGHTMLAASSNVVQVTPGTSSSGGGDSAAPPYWLYAAIGGAGIVVALGAVLLFRRGRKEIAPLTASPASVPEDVPSRRAELRAREMRRR